MRSDHILLVALGLSAIPEFIGGNLDGLTVAFVPTAAEPYEDRSFVERDRTLLRKMGFEVVDVTLEGKTSDELRDEVANADVLFIAGGNTFYLLQEIRASGFDRVISELLDRGVRYIGASAGAIVIGPDTAPVSTLDDPAAAKSLTDFTGLGLVDFVVLPHYGDSVRAEYDTIVDSYSDKLSLVPLRNDQAVVVRDGNPQVVASP